MGVRRGKGNTVERFHGTSRTCGKSLDVCDDDSCRACGILRGGFDITRVGQNTNGYARFGRGIYSTATSSKADDYAGMGVSGTGHTSTRVLLLCRVVAGKVKKLVEPVRFKTTLVY